VSFEAAFFGSGNRITWEAIQAGSLSPEVQTRLGPFLEDFRHSLEVVVLPRVREDGRVQWYVLCSSERMTRIARDEVRAFLGPTYSDIDGPPTQLDPADPVEAAVLERNGINAFRVDISERRDFEIARERLRLLMRLRRERPTRHARRLRAVGRILRDFEYALLVGDPAAAGALIEELRFAGHLSATNLLFLEVRRLAAGRRWDAILEHADLEALLAMPRPSRVTEAIIRAVYASELQQFEEGQHASEAIEHFSSAILPRFRELYRSRAAITGYEVDASFLMAAVSAIPSRRAAVDAILETYPPASPQHAYLSALAKAVPVSAERTVGNVLDQARAAFANADIDQSYRLASALPPSFERTTLLLRSAREMGTLASAQTALESIDSLPESDRLRLDQNAVVCRIRDALRELSVPNETPASLPAASLELPSTWTMWLKKLTGNDIWRGAVPAAEIASREWSISNFTRDSAAIREVADLLLGDRPEWGQSALRDALPHLLEFFLGSGAEARLKPVYESLLLLLAVDEQISLPQASALLQVVDVRLQLGVTTPEYREMIRHLAAAIQMVESPSVATTALEAIEVLINAPCPAPSEREEFVAVIAAVFQRWYRRIDAAQCVLLRQLTAEIGVDTQLPEIVSEGDGGEEWAALSGKKVCFYSLQESALRRAALAIRELCPGARTDTFHDHVGGSPALRTASATADVFVLATGAAKHAATIFIEAHRPSRLTTLRARGKGSASLLDVLRLYLRGPIQA
jgi:hypothetical protein